MRPLVLAAVTCTLFGALIADPTTAQSDEELPREDLARVLLGEADGSQPDWAAILWTLQHRQERMNRTMREVLPCSSVLRASTKRQKQIMSLGTDDPDWGDHPTLRQKQWEDALRFVDAWADGRVKDPCPRALHWRGTNDRKPEHRVIVSCGATKNEFFYMKGDRIDGSKAIAQRLRASPLLGLGAGPRRVAAD